MFCQPRGICHWISRKLTPEEKRIAVDIGRHWHPELSLLPTCSCLSCQMPSQCKTIVGWYL